MSDRIDRTAPQQESKGDSSIVTARMVGFAHGGACVGAIESGAPTAIGKKIFIPFTAPGDLVRARLVADHARHSEGEVLEVLEPSTTRTEPPCPLFGQCGGCDYQHIEIGAQREYKRAMIEAMFNKQGGITLGEGVRIAGEALPAYHYRSRVDLHLSGTGELGFYRAGTGEVVDCERCLLVSPPLNEALGGIRTIRKDLAPFVGGVRLEELGDATVFVVLALRDHVTDAESHALSSLLSTQGWSFSLTRRGRVVGPRESSPESSPGHFSQVNREGNEILTELVLQGCTGTRITELYAGAGNFSFPLAMEGKSVTAVEGDHALVAQGELRLKRSPQLDLAFVHSSCEKYVRRAALAPTVLLDPPRSGAAGVLSALCAPAVQEIVYVSCGLPTLVRDAKVLVAHGFELVSVNFVDMFAQTHHVESVTVFRRQCGVVPCKG